MLHLRSNAPPTLQCSATMLHLRSTAPPTLHCSTNAPTLPQRSAAPLLHLRSDAPPTLQCSNAPPMLQCSKNAPMLQKRSKRRSPESTTTWPLPRHKYRLNQAICSFNGRAHVLFVCPSSPQREQC